MRTLQKKLTALGLIQALMLAVLINLSGHIFLHLGDSLLEVEATHLAAKQEEKGFSSAQHICSVCQDHQHLSLDVPSNFATPSESLTCVPTQVELTTHSATSYGYKPTRAPPRN